MEEEIKACVKAMIRKIVKKAGIYTWRENNKELYRARQRVHDKKYYQKVKEKNKEIFRERSEAWRENNPEKYGEVQMKYNVKKNKRKERKYLKEIREKAKKLTSSLE